MAIFTNPSKFWIFCLFPRSPAQTGLICGKTLEPNISRLGPFKIVSFKYLIEFYPVTQPPNSYLNFSWCSELLGFVHSCQRRQKINNRRQENNGNNTKKTLEDFQKCSIMSRQEPAYFSNEVLCGPAVYFCLDQWWSPAAWMNFCSSVMG